MPISELNDLDMPAVHHSCCLNLLDIAAATAAHDIPGARSAWSRYVAALTIAEQAGGNLHTACSPTAKAWRSSLANALRLGDLEDAAMAVEAYTRQLLHIERHPREFRVAA